MIQFQKEAKEAEYELQHEKHSIEVQKVRQQLDLSNAKSELAKAQATILHQSERIQHLESYQRQPPTERQFPSALELLNELHRRRRTKTREIDIEIILEILEGESDANLN